MTHQAESTILDTVVTTILDNGFDGLVEAVTMLPNEAMKIESSRFLRAAPWICWKIMGYSHAIHNRGKPR